MYVKFLNLIMEWVWIGNYFIIGGNCIYWLKILDNFEFEEVELEVFYMVFYYVREFNSLVQFIFYMWYLLENYEKDEEICYLFDNMVFYFIFCVNLDGYFFN